MNPAHMCLMAPWRSCSVTSRGGMVAEASISESSGLRSKVKPAWLINPGWPPPGLRTRGEGPQTSQKTFLLRVLRSTNLWLTRPASHSIDLKRYDLNPTLGDPNAP